MLGRSALVLAAGAVALLAVPNEPARADSKPPSERAWSKVKKPTGQPAQAIGGYSRGCVAGAEELPVRGAGYQVIRPERRRHFGHPALVGFILDLAAQMKQGKLGLLAIADLSQPRGGPAPGGHASHQSGLDVDLWYVPPGKNGTGAVSMVDAAREQPAAAFDDRVRTVLRLAASDERVDRIFVNPVLKRALCESVTGDRTWLRKIRPWWKHDEHFHVRLACPADSPACEAQAALPAGDGCDGLDWWFRKTTDDDRTKQRAKYRSKISQRDPLPDRCTEIMRAPAGKRPRR